MGRAVGLGGAFLRTSNPKELYSWYETHLKLECKQGCFIFPDAKQGSGYTVVAFFARDTKYFDRAGAGSSTQPVMLNFRVEGLDELLDELSRSGVEVDPKRETYEYGKFGWITDPEGNKVELWEPPAS
ncbi:MAG TPA: VOC family protein [Acidisarcina sp.]